LIAVDASGLTARVKCVARIARQIATDPLLKLPGGGPEITPKHPVWCPKTGQWRRPKDLPGAQAVYPADVSADGTYYVYNFLLDGSDSPIMLVDGVGCIVWGHGLNDAAVHHSYFGDRTKIEADLAAMPGWSQGVVSISTCQRNPLSGSVVGMRATAPRSDEV